MNVTKLSISLDAEKKKILEGMAKSNYRSLNGEINMAIDLYINQVTNGNKFIQVQPFTASIDPVQVEEVKQEETTMTMDSFGDDEVDDF